MSKVKKNLSAADVEKIFNRHCTGEIVSCKALTGGTFNSVYKIETKDKKAYIIKIAPDNNTDVLTYEKNIIASELRFFELLEKSEVVRFPKIYGYNIDEGYPYKYIVMEFIEGEMLNKAKLGKEERTKAMYKLGQAIAEIHSIDISDGYGYMQQDLSTSFKSAYKSMTDNVINDGLKVTKSLPYLKRIRDAIEKHIDEFDALDKAVLTHFDLWPGNLIVKNGELYGIIDCERCMLGDPVGDFISLDYMAPIEKAVPKELIEGYNSKLPQSSRITFNKNQTIRFYLMRLYLGLIVYTETYYRCSKYSPEFIGRLAFGRIVIRNALKQLEKI